MNTVMLRVRPNPAAARAPCAGPRGRDPPKVHRGRAVQGGEQEHAPAPVYASCRSRRCLPSRWLARPTKSRSLFDPAHAVARRKAGRNNPDSEGGHAIIRPLFPNNAHACPNSVPLARDHRTRAPCPASASAVPAECAWWWSSCAVGTRKEDLTGLDAEADGVQHGGASVR